MQVFGVFVAFGVMAAWCWTITVISAFVTLIPESWLADFGRKPADDDHGDLEGRLGRAFAGSRPGAPGWWSS